MVGELVRVDEVVHLLRVHRVFAQHALRLYVARPVVAARRQLLHVHGQMHRPGARPVSKELLPEPHEPIRALGVQGLHLRETRSPLRPVLPRAPAPAHHHAEEDERAPQGHQEDFPPRQPPTSGNADRCWIGETSDGGKGRCWRRSGGHGDDHEVRETYTQSRDDTACRRGGAVAAGGDTCAGT